MLNNVRELVQKYVDGAIELLEFRSLFVPIFLDSEGEEKQLAYAIEGECSDFSEGFLPDEDGLKRVFATRLSNLSAVTIRYQTPMVVAPSRAVVETGTSTDLVWGAAWGQPVGIGRAKVYA